MIKMEELMYLGEDSIRYREANLVTMLIRKEYN